LVRLSSHPKLFSVVASYELYHLSKSLAVAFGYSLTFLSINLLSRKRRAWAIALGMAIVSLLLQLARIGSEHIRFLQDHQLAQDIPSYSCLPPILAIGFLISARSYFTVKS